MSAVDAAMDISLEDYERWGEAERVVVNVQTLYREFSEDQAQADVIQQFAEMAKLWRHQAKKF